MRLEMRKVKMWMGRSAVLCVLLLALGCRQPQFASVEGVVTLDGVPMADVEVQFIPEPDQEIASPPTSAYTDANGRFQVAATGTYGVLIATHRVCINDATLMMPGGGLAVDPESGVPTQGQVKTRRAPRSRVPAIYSDAGRTPLRPIEIQPGQQTHDFALTTG